MFEEMLVSFFNVPYGLNLVGAAIVVDESDHEGVHIAATNLSEDVARTTGGQASPILRWSEGRIDNSQTEVAVIVGCIERSPLLRRLEEAAKADYSPIKGKWEMFHVSVVEDPFDGCRTALVIAGSDKRGTIYGAYTLSEQIGVSPWYWWADVPPTHHPEIYALPKTTIHGPPSVKYRGIFINDEAPALTGWVREQFGGYNVRFYKKAFELLLRLKANFLWPAMWPGYPNPGASFFTDDPENQRTADAYGIVMSTSHHEPMQRLSNEWLAEGNPLGSWDWLSNKDKITEFFKTGVERAKGCESYFTVGMRGEYDTKMKGDDPAAVVRDVLRTQRSLIKDVYGREDAVPQLLALYKEVQEQYESGKLDVPDDVTLLFSDDNFGSIRRLPHGDEANRNGGAGIYYHFEYVGSPRSYKWLNSNSSGKTWHQLQQAHRRGASQIWVFNVGDIKPLEVPLTFAMSLAWDVNSIRADGNSVFFHELALHQFGPELSDDIARAWHEHDRLVSLRRHEHIEPTTFSPIHYNEADAIATRWESLAKLAHSIHGRASPEQRPAVFQLVLHPIKATAVFVLLQIELARNQLYARQRRNSANLSAERALELFEADFDLSEEYHALLEGKWKGIMCQPHYGFGDTWHAPSRDMISGLCYVQTRQGSNPIVGHMGVMVEGHAGVRPGVVNENSDFTHPSRGDLVPGVTLGPMSRYGPEKRWFELFTRGTETVHWTARVPCATRVLRLSRWSGTLIPGEEDQRVEVEVTWDEVRDDLEDILFIEISSEEGDFEKVHLPILGRRVPGSFQGGYVEADGYISMPAPSFKALKPPYRALPDTGRLLTGSVTLDPDAEGGPAPYFLDYRYFVFSDLPADSRPRLIMHFNMTLEYDPADPVTYEFSVDDGPVSRQRLIEPNPTADPELPSSEDWLTAVQDCVWNKEHILNPSAAIRGEHVLHVRLLHKNAVFEKIILDLGGVKDSYLGPPASFFVRA